MMDFKALYDHILSSEQSAVEMQERLCKVKEDIAKCQRDTKTANTALQQLEASLDHDELKLTEERANTEVLKLQVRVLEERRQQLRHSVGELEKKLKQGKDESDANLELFLSDIREFMRNYDLLHSGLEERAKRRTREVEDAEELEERTREELELAKAELTLLTKNRDEKKRLQAEIAAIQRNIIDLDEAVETKREESNKLRREIKDLTSDHGHDWLKTELSKTQNSATVANDRVVRLRGELTDLQRQKWQRSLNDSAGKNRANLGKDNRPDKKTVTCPTSMCL